MSLDWTQCCGLLKWWQVYVCHTQKMKNVDSKNIHRNINNNKKKIEHHIMNNLIVRCNEFFPI